MIEKTLLLDGMSCGHCVAGVRNALESLGSVTVKNVTVGSATIVFDETRVTDGEITAAVDDAGYAVRQAIDAASPTLTL